MGLAVVFYMPTPKQQKFNAKDTMEIVKKYRDALFLTEPYKPDLRKSVYIVECEGLYKIGYTFNIEKRLHTLQVGSPYLIRLVTHVKTDNHKALESNIHSMFAPKRVRGEWFKLEEQDLNNLLQILENA